VIAKYFTLRSLNIADAQLRLIYVKAKVEQPSEPLTVTKSARSAPPLKADTSIPASLIAHMVLAYYPPNQSDPLILDNLNPTILPASKRQDLIPVFSFNSISLFPANAGLSPSSRSVLASKEQTKEPGISGLSSLAGICYDALHAEGFDE